VWSGGAWRAGVHYDFSAHLAEADIQSPGADHVPEKPGFSQKPGFWLAFAVATAPESWEQPGDGVTFAVYVESGQDMQPETRNPKLETYVAPRQDEADRRWHPYTVDLSDYAGQTVTITFETGVGPAGDERYDWAGWGAPRLLGR